MQIFDGLALLRPAAWQTLTSFQGEMSNLLPYSLLERLELLRVRETLGALLYFEDRRECSKETRIVCFAALAFLIHSSRRAFSAGSLVHVVRA